MSSIAGGSFWEGFENGAFYGAIAGLVSGGMAFIFTGGVTSVSLTLGQTLLTGATSGGGSSLVGDLGDKFFKGDDISWKQMLLNTAVAATLAAAFAGAFYGLSKGLAALKLKFINGKAKLSEAVGAVDDTIEGATNTLTDAQKSRLNTLENTVNDHLTEGDFSGTLRDLQGNPVPNGKEGYFDHLGEMKDSYRSLQKIKKALEGSLKNPNLSEVDRRLLQEGLDKANSFIKRVEELFAPYGGIE